MAPYRIPDKSGMRFGKLVVIEQARVLWGRTHWLCRCDCGREEIRRDESLHGRSIPACCSCLRDLRTCLGYGNRTHGLSKTKLYQVYRSMIRRCTVPSAAGYHDYGGRGISVCGEWTRDVYVFMSWAKSSGYRVGLSIDRINNDGNYEPANCRWATIHQQAMNKRPRRKRESTTPRLPV